MRLVARGKAERNAPLSSFFGHTSESLNLLVIDMNAKMVEPCQDGSYSHSKRSQNSKTGHVCYHFRNDPVSLLVQVCDDMLELCCIGSSFMSLVSDLSNHLLD